MTDEYLLQEARLHFSDACFVTRAPAWELVELLPVAMFPELGEQPCNFIPAAPEIRAKMIRLSPRARVDYFDRYCHSDVKDIKNQYLLMLLLHLFDIARDMHSELSDIRRSGDD